MKTTKAQQDQTRTRIVRTAVSLMGERGFDAVTMKDIAGAAGVGDATIYKYFPSKERLVLGYFDWVAQEATVATRATPEYADYELQSRLQRLTDAVLELLEPDRAFVAQARTLLARAPLLMLGEQLKAKQILKDQVLADLEHAVITGEIASSDFLGLMSGLYVDYCLGVMAYWLQDESPGASDTPRFIDQTLGILVAMLRSGLPDRLVQLGLFVVRSQMARWMHGSHASKDPAAESPPLPARRPRRRAPSSPPPPSRSAMSKAEAESADEPPAAPARKTRTRKKTA